MAETMQLGAQNKIAPEVANAAFDTWASAMDLTRKLDPSTMDKEDKKSLVDQKQTILNAIMDGFLIVDDSGQFVYRQQKGNSEPIVFYEPTGADLMAVDQLGKSGMNEVAKMFAILASMTKQNRSRFSDMKNRDLAVCQAILALFMAR